MNTEKSKALINAITDGISMPTFHRNSISLELAHSIVMREILNNLLTYNNGFKAVLTGITAPFEGTQYAFFAFSGSPSKGIEDILENQLSPYKGSTNTPVSTYNNGRKLAIRSLMACNGGVLSNGYYLLEMEEGDFLSNKKYLNSVKFFQSDSQANRYKLEYDKNFPVIEYVRNSLKNNLTNVPKCTSTGDGEKSVFEARKFPFDKLTWLLIVPVNLEGESRKLYTERDFLITVRSLIGLDNHNFDDIDIGVLTSELVGEKTDGFNTSRLVSTSMPKMKESMFIKVNENTNDNYKITDFNINKLVVEKEEEFILEADVSIKFYWQVGSLKKSEGEEWFVKMEEDGKIPKQSKICGSNLVNIRKFAAGQYGHVIAPFRAKYYVQSGIDRVKKSPCCLNDLTPTSMTYKLNALLDLPENKSVGFTNKGNPFVVLEINDLKTHLFRDKKYRVQNSEPIQCHSDFIVDYENSRKTINILQEEALDYIIAHKEDFTKEIEKLKKYLLPFIDDVDNSIYIAYSNGNQKTTPKEIIMADPETKTIRILEDEDRALTHKNKAGYKLRSSDISREEISIIVGFFDKQDSRFLKDIRHKVPQSAIEWDIVEFNAKPIIKGYKNDTKIDISKAYWFQVTIPPLGVREKGKGKIIAISPEEYKTKDPSFKRTVCKKNRFQSGDEIFRFPSIGNIEDAECNKKPNNKEVGEDKGGISENNRETPANNIRDCINDVPDSDIPIIDINENGFPVYNKSAYLVRNTMTMKAVHGEKMKSFIDNVQHAISAESRALNNNKGLTTIEGHRYRYEKERPDWAINGTSDAKAKIIQLNMSFVNHYDRQVKLPKTNLKEHLIKSKKLEEVQNHLKDLKEQLV